MATLFVIYSAMFFAVESARNMIRVYQVIRRQYVNAELARNLDTLSWIFILTGFILGFTSNLLFLPCILFVRVAAGMLIQTYFGDNKQDAKIDELIRVNSQKLIMTKQADIKLIGGSSHANHNRYH
jgi:hypothetical protein